MTAVREIPFHHYVKLEDYATRVALRSHVQSLRDTAETHLPTLHGRRVWMVNSTATGGGVAEMLPGLLGVLRELGVDVHWLVIDPDSGPFFKLTKQLHNMLHASGEPTLDDAAAALYRDVSESLAAQLCNRMGPDDILVVHDPQPLGAGALAVDRLGMTAVWRCHIGVDEPDATSRSAWEFLQPWLGRYERHVFTLREYVPETLLRSACIIPPAVDPFSHKNRELSVHKLSGILTGAQLVRTEHPAVAPPFGSPALRLQADGSFAPATQPEDFGLLFRPIVTQISRWDRLKGWSNLLEGFVRMKRNGSKPVDNGRHRSRLEAARLVMAGPDPGGVSDDPEGKTVLDDLVAQWLELEPELQRDVALLLLPMDDLKANALMVNALQRCSTIVAQCSLREGFGLTVTEAMVKGCAVLGSPAAGIRSQIQDGVQGRLLQDSSDPQSITTTLEQMLSQPKRNDAMRFNAERRAVDHFLLFRQAERWLHLLGGLNGRHSSRPPPMPDA